MGKIQIPGSGGGGTDTDGATATTNDILKGKTAAIAGQEELATGTLEVQSIINFSAALSSSRAILLTWQLPAKGPYSGVYIMYGTDKYPESISDGTLAYEGALSTATISGLPANATCYFRAWPYITTNIGRLYGRYADSSAVATEFKGQQVFTGSTTWTVPANVYSLDIFGVGRGQDGSRGYGKDGGEGGNGGETVTLRAVQVLPSQAITVIVGYNTAVQVNGVQILLAATGQGLIGGAGGAQRWPSLWGGANGQTGARAFGESGYAIYGSSGGGGGGEDVRDGADIVQGFGGTGGSGAGHGGFSPLNSYNRYGGNAAYGTGSGGGGGSFNYYEGWSGGQGSSGAVIIRWGY